MKHLILIILALVTANSFGQGTSKETVKTDYGKVRIGINFSPDICYRTLKDNVGTSFNGELIKQRNESETFKIGYSTGMSICFNVNKSVELETGFQYSNKGYRTKKYDLTFGYSEPGLPEKAKSISNFHYLDIPLKANFTFGEKRLRLIAGIGVITNISISESQTNFLYYSDHTDRSTDPISNDIKRVNLSPTISLGIDYKINEKMNLRVEPTFRYGVLKVIDSAVIAYLYSGGLSINYYFKL